MSKTFDLSTLDLPAGTHEITVKARASGYADSRRSNAVMYNVGGEVSGEYLVSGTWYFNEKVDDDTDGEEVRFTSNGTAYDYMRFDLGYPETFIYGNDDGEDVAFIARGTGWTNQAYRTITFDGVQPVSKEFYEWLCANTDTPFTTNIPKIEIEANGSSFTGMSQIILSGGTGNYTVADSAITSNEAATTELTGCVYTINWHLQDAKDHNGAYTITFSDGETTIDFPITVDGLLCLTGDSLITLADGTQKRIDQITLRDKVLAINPATGELCEDIITFTDSDSVKKHYHYHKFAFEDGTVIKTVHRHRFYNIEEQQMSHLDLFYVGDHVVKQDGTTTRLISGEEIEEDVQHYTIFTRYQNYFVNGILSGNRFTPYMSLGKIPEQEAEIEGQGVPVFNGGGTSHSSMGHDDITLLAGSAGAPGGKGE